jgi:hypothetical protein
MTDRTTLHRQIYGQAAKHIPEKGWGATVAIVLAHEGAVHQFGSGTLFRVGDDSFVVTASHIIKKASAHVKTLGITSAANSIVAVPGTWMCSSEAQYGSTHDPFDVAVHKLSKDAIDKLGSKSYLTFDDIEFQAQSATAVYTLFGFPGIWSDSTKTDTDRLQVKPLQFTTYAYDRDTGVFKDYQERFHILLDAQLAQSIADDGSPAKFTDLEGSDAPFPDALGGISGCSVWRIGDLHVPIDKWSQDASRLVAVLTGGYDPKEAIIATKWVAVSTLLYEGYPEVRKAMQPWLTK